MDTDAIMREMQASFRIEAEELVTDLEESLLQLESDNENSTLIDRVFRSLHTLKGSGSSAGFNKLAAFLHIFEDAFNLAREGKMEVTQDLIDLSLKTVDRITQFVSEEPGSAFDKAAIEADPILVDLRKIMPRSKSADTAVDEASSEEPAAEIGIYTIDFVPNDTFLEFGNEPISLIDEIRALGQASIKATPTIPRLADLDPTKIYITWHIELVSEAPIEDIEEVFSFVEMDADITIDRNARTIDPSSNKAGLFDPNTLEDYEVESRTLVSNIQSLLEASAASESLEDVWTSVERSFHSLKGNTGILLSSTTESLKPNHPLRSILALAEAGEDLSSRTIDECHAPEEPERRSTAIALAEAIASLSQAFHLGYVPFPVSAELLDSLGLSDLNETPKAEPEPTPLSPQEEAFNNIFKQSLIMLEGVIAALENSSPDKELPIVQRAVANVKRAALVAKKDSIASLCESIAEKLASPPDSADALKSVLTDSIQSLDAASKEAAAQAEPPEPTAPQTTKETKAPAAAAPKSKPSLRVDEDKIDRLMRAIGELLVARGAFPLIAKNLNETHGLNAVAQELREAGSNVSRLADELQSAVMSIRMRPLQTLFQRFPRMIRDVSKSLGKEIEFVVEGEETELDKSMVDQLGDPLVHILRNALDHGIETAEERAKTSKNPVATISLRALTEGSTVAIKIQDDGRGLNPDKLKKKAIEKGLITPAEADILSPNAAYELIMRPGFSTAEQVTDLSGRGVGMDVVANNIRNLHGSIEIDSSFGHGSTFTLRLPTSLLVSEAILVSTGKEEYLIPMDNVSSLEKISRSHIRTHGGSRMIPIRGNVVNIVDLCELLNAPRDDYQLPDLLNIALVHTLDGYLGIIVDKFVSQEEIVVKPLSGELAAVSIFSGVSIMGDGRVVPVLNSREIQNFYLKNAEQTAETILQA